MFARSMPALRILTWLADVVSDGWGAVSERDLGEAIIQDKLRHGTGRVYAGTGFAIDARGHYYVGGVFEGSARFGTNLLTSAHRFQFDGFIAKYDQQFRCLWVKQIRGGEASSVAAFATNALFVAGHFSGETALDGHRIQSQSGEDILLAKYDLDGNLLWFKQAGGSDKRFASYATSVTVDFAGNSYITGEFGGSGVFDNITLSPNPIARALFVAKYDPAGNVLWAKEDAHGSCDPKGIALDRWGNIYVTGGFFGTVRFGSEAIGAAKQDGDMFLVKYDSGGNFLWVRSPGGPPKRIGWNVAVDPRGDPHVAGLIHSTLAFGATHVVVANKRYENTFVAKYSATGDFQWVRQFQEGDFDFSNVVGVEIVGIKRMARPLTNET